MEEELEQAKHLYESNLAEIKQALAAAPADAEQLLLVQEELQTALQSTNEALAELQGPRAPPPPPSTTRPRQAQRSFQRGQIHPRSLYADVQPDFEALALQYPALEQYLIPLPCHGSGKIRKKETKEATPESVPDKDSPIDAQVEEANASNSAVSTALPFPGTASATPSTQLRRCTFDFANPAACRELTKTLLAADFGVTWNLPDGHLVPPVTNRLNYILWIEDLVKLSSPSLTEGGSSIRGMDVGCGASLIYPLLGAAVLGWHFVAVDVTEEAIEWANRNLDANLHLKYLIDVRKVGMQLEQAQFFGKKRPRAGDEEEEKESTGAGILRGAVRKGEYFTFTMCNPPFFDDMSQASANPSTAFGGTMVESTYPGGESAFVENMVLDSLILREQVHWYTTMVGKKATLKSVKKRLYAEPSVRVVRTTEFVQGQTSRWGIAWSFAADPEVAMRPLQREGGGGSAGADVRGHGKRHASGAAAAGGGEEGCPAVSDEFQRAKRRRKVIGRTASMQISVQNAANAPARILQSIKAHLEGKGSLHLECSPVDAQQYSLQATPLLRDGSTVRTTNCGTISVHLLAQAPKVFVVTVALGKGGPATPAVLSWFGDVVAVVEEAVAQHGRILD